MNASDFRDIMSGRRRGWRAALLRIVARLASGPYAAVVTVRRWAYRRGLLRRRSAGAPVISVGNMTAGGTGKTPMVAMLVEELRRIGRRPGVLLRGYRPTAEGLSDEAELLRRLCTPPDDDARPDAVIAVNPDRAAGAGEALAAGADVLVMDDGFQHLRLRRDLDIVLMDATDPWGGGHVLPRGLLREPPRALRDAGAIVITRSDAVSAATVDELAARLGALAPQASIHRAVHRPTALIDAEGRSHDADALAGRKVCAVCGIGNPDAFFEMLGRLHVRPAAQVALGDHADYDASTLETVRRRLVNCEAEVVLTTQKDHVKLAPGDLPRPVWQLAVEMEITEGRDELIGRVREAIGERA